MKLIKLTQGKFAQVDDEDYEWLNQWKWYAWKHGNTYYAKRNIRLTKNTRKKESMHRILLNIIDPKLLGDHEDHDGLNNQRSNLRIATSSQNGRNRTSSKGATSKYLGVSFNKKRKCWVASLEINNKSVYAGSYKNEIDAAIAYDNKAKELHKEFANLNFK